MTIAGRNAYATRPIHRNWRAGKNGLVNEQLQRQLDGIHEKAGAIGECEHTSHVVRKGSVVKFAKCVPIPFSNGCPVGFCGLQLYASRWS